LNAVECFARDPVPSVPLPLKTPIKVSSQPAIPLSFIQPLILVVW
jgi:hypothetical protein